MCLYRALRRFRKCIRRQVVALEDLASVIDSTAPVSGLAEPGWEGCITCTGHAYGARRPADSSTSSLQAARATYFPDAAATELNLKGLAARESSSWVLFPGASRSLRMPALIFGRIGWFAPIAWLVGSAARDPNQKEFPQVPPRRHSHGLTAPEEGRPLVLNAGACLEVGCMPDVSWPWGRRSPCQQDLCSRKMEECARFDWLRLQYSTLERNGPKLSCGMFWWQASQVPQSFSGSWCCNVARQGNLRFAYEGLAAEKSDSAPWIWELR